MRVSDTLMHRFFNHSTGRAKAQYFQAGEATVRLSRLERPSDDLASAQKVLGLDRARERLSGLERTRQTLLADFSVVESTVQAISDTLIELKELSVQMANDTLNASDRGAGAATAQAIRGTLLDLANTRQADGRYLLSGTREDAPAFDAAGDYLGGLSARRVEIAPDSFVSATFTAPEVFGAQSPIGVVDDLVAALESNDLEGIQLAIEALDGLLASSSIALTEVGTRIRRTQDAAALSESMDFHFQVFRGELQDLDLADAVTRFDAAEQSLNAVIAVSRRMMGMTIMPYLK